MQRLKNGTPVRTAISPLHDAEYTMSGRRERRWGVTGVVQGYHDSHGLCYEVLHEDGTVGTYEEDEIMEVPKRRKGRPVGAKDKAKRKPGSGRPGVSKPRPVRKTPLAPAARIALLRRRLVRQQAALDRAAEKVVQARKDLTQAFQGHKVVLLEGKYSGMLGRVQGVGLPSRKTVCGQNGWSYLTVVLYPADNPTLKQRRFTMVSVDHYGVKWRPA